MVDKLKGLKNKRVLGIFALAMINVSLILTLRSLPTMAEYGSSIVFYFLVATVIFFVPTALVSAELATGWPKTGGVYAWAQEAFGPRWAFVTIWLQWIENVVWFPTALAATAATLAYIFNPAMANNKLFIIFITLSVFWGATLLNFRGMKLSGRVSSVGAILGVILPGILLVVLAGVWLALGNPSQITFNAKDMFPDITNINNLALLVAILLSLMGIEVSAAHAQEVKNPSRDYPKAIFLSALIVVGIFLLGALAIAVVVPQKEISLTAGVMQTFLIIFDKFNIKWAVVLLALIGAPGMIAQISTWLVGPTKGLLAAAKNGDLPPSFRHLNNQGMPTTILIIQAIIVTIFSFIFLFMPTVSSGYLILTTLTVQVYLMMYIIMFMAAIKLRYSRPNVARAYKIPGGHLGMWLVAGIGVLAALVALFIGCFPPSQIPVGGTLFYIGFLVLGVIITFVLPFIFYHFRRPSWALKTK
jgi:glutamate:GABA antiporter